MGIEKIIPTTNTVFSIGRVCYGAMLIYIGYQILESGHQLYGPFWHATRKAVLGAKSMNRINETLTYEDINKMITQGLGVLMMFGGMLTALNK